MGFEVNEIARQLGSDQVTIPLSEPFNVVKEKWSPLDPGPINMIRGETIAMGQEKENKLLHVKALLTTKRKPIIVLIDTGSSCNILQKSYCKKHGFVVQPCEKELTGFNGSTSKVLGLVNVLVSIGKWSSTLPFLCA